MTCLRRLLFYLSSNFVFFFFFFQAEDGIRDFHVTGVQTCALPICDGTGYREYPPGDFRPDRVAFEVLVHSQPRQRRPDHKRDDDEQGKVAGDQVDNTDDRSPQHFSDANFLCALFCGEGGESEQTQTGDNDSKNSKQACQSARQVDGCEFLLELLIDESVLKRIGWSVSCKDRLDCL